MNVIRKCSKKLTLSCALAVLAVVAPLQVSAQSVITIDEAETMTNGGNPVADGDSIIVTDTGSIATVGSVDAILVNDGNTITNSGRIFAQGVDANGIQADDNNTITNSGFIVSAQGDSFNLGTGNTLNLLAPSFLGGPITGANTSVNIVTGASHSILWDFSQAGLDNANFSGSGFLQSCDTAGLDLSGTAFFGDEMEGFQAQAKFVSAF